jgi:hypothetical protein
MVLQGATVTRQLQAGFSTSIEVSSGTFREFTTMRDVVVDPGIR